MQRKLFNLIAAMSLILLMALGVLWVRSYHVNEAYVWERAGSKTIYHYSGILSARGVLQYAREDTGYPVYLLMLHPGYQTRSAYQAQFGQPTGSGHGGFAGFVVEGTVS